MKGRIEKRQDGAGGMKGSIALAFAAVLILAIAPRFRESSRGFIARHSRLPPLDQSRVVVDEERSLGFRGKHARLIILDLAPPDQDAVESVSEPFPGANWRATTSARWVFEKAIMREFEAECARKIMEEGGGIYAQEPIPNRGATVYLPDSGNLLYFLYCWY